MNSKYSKPSKRHLLILNFTDKLDSRRSENSIALSNLSIYYTKNIKKNHQKNIKSSYNNNKFEISVPTQNDKTELPDGSFSVLDIQDQFEYIFKKHGENTDNPSIKVYVNKIERSHSELKMGTALNFHCIKMRYSAEPKDRLYVKGYGFLSFAKNVGKNLSNKYSQKLLDSAKKYATDAIKTASKREIRKQQKQLVI